MKVVNCFQSKYQQGLILLNLILDIEVAE